MRAMMIGLAAVAAPAGAQALPPALLGCAATVDDTARLACFDRAVSAASGEARAVAERRERAAAEARAAKQAADAKAAAAAAEQADAAKRAAFGQETLPADRRPEPYPDQVRELTAKVSEVLVSPLTGRAVIVLDNGMMWRQTDGLDLPPVRAGADVMVKRGAMGSYRLTLPRIGRTVTVVRMR